MDDLITKWLAGEIPSTFTWSAPEAGPLGLPDGVTLDYKLAIGDDGEYTYTLSVAGPHEGAARFVQQFAERASAGGWVVDDETS